MSETKHRWILSYVFHLIVACLGTLLCCFIVSIFLPAAKSDPSAGPYFWGAITFGIIGGFLVGRKAKPSILSLLWVIPCILMLSELYSWWKYQYAGENLRENIYNNFLSRDCSASECLAEGFLTTPLISSLCYGVVALLAKLSLRNNLSTRKASALMGLAITATFVLGCTRRPLPTSAPAATTSVSTQTTRPTTPPPPIKLFHQTSDSITLITTPDATDQQVSAILWQLRDAAHNHTFDALHIPQKFVDARSPNLWFHLYRGTKCAAEKYAPGAPPCGPSYHAAGDYTLGSLHNPNWDSGVLLTPSTTDDPHETNLWPPGSPYIAPNP